MAKLRHLAFVCKDPKQIADFLSKAFDIEVLYHTDPPGVVVLSDGDMNFTLLPESFAQHDPVPWHFGLEMTHEEIEARRPVLEEMGVAIHEGVRDGRPVEMFLHTPEGHRIDLAPFWPTKRGQTRRQEGYKAWEGAEEWERGSGLLAEDSSVRPPAQEVSASGR
jgi:hypothetical protein